MNLSYSGSVELESNVNQQSKDMLDALLAADSADTPLSVDSGQIRPLGDSVTLLVSLSASGDISEIEDVRDQLADDVVGLGLEETAEDAADAINIGA